MADTLAALHATLFPEETFAEEQLGALAAKLREVADALEAPARLASGKKKRQSRELDFGRYQQRHVALEVLYLGHDYHGFARQDTTVDTIEECLFAALVKTRLIPADSTWQGINYSRGGRTDKGVSGLGQVVALMVRSCGPAGESLVPENSEYDYPSLLNSVLPRAIRILGWTTVPESFNARFSAQFREYKYFIVNDGTLNVEAMREAAQHLVGEHDFRNFCKADVLAVKSFIRRVLEVRLEATPGLEWGQRGILELYIRGTAFLWHQVRCIAAVLLMVGRGQEQPSIVSILLDIQRVPAKPTYAMASDEPLLLFSCAYTDLVFRRTKKAYKQVLESVDASILSHLTRAAMIHAMETRMGVDEVEQAEGEERKMKPQSHVSLLSRPVEASIHERRQRATAVLAARGLLPPTEWSA